MLNSKLPLGVGKFEYFNYLVNLEFRQGYKYGGYLVDGFNKGGSNE